MKKRKVQKVLKKYNKKLLLAISILLLIILIVLMLLIFSDYKEKEKQQKIYTSIKNSYSNNVEVIKNANLYIKEKSDYKKIGTVSKGEIISLENKKIKNYNDKYFNIKGTNYFVKYNFVSPYKGEKQNDNYVYLNYGKQITTKNYYEFFLNDKTVYSFNKSDVFEVIINQEDHYVVRYNDKLLNIKKEFVENEVNDEKVSNIQKISVLYYENIFDDKTSKCEEESCVKLSSFENNIKYLTDNSYVSINLNDYLLWKNNKIKLPEKTVLIMVNQNDIIGNANSIILNNIDDSIKFNDNNKPSILGEEVNSRYKIINKTTDDIFKKIMEGKTISYVTKSIGNGIAVLNYHFFYDPQLGEKCGEIICEPVAMFKEHLNYLKENNFKTLSIEEFRAWIYEEKELPKKSVLITIDDGAMGTSKINGNKLIPLLEEYDMKATLFLITAWWQKENYYSPNLDIQSHGYDIHKTGDCGRAKAACLSHDDLVSDLKKSIPLVDSATSIAYPFYIYNDKIIESVKASGFKMAFTGGGKKAYRNSNKYAIPRYEIFNSTSFESFKKYVN